MLFILLLLLLHISGGGATTITLLNSCPYAIWPAVLSNANSPPLSPTGFTLPPSASRSFLLPSSWSGRFWARTSCSLTPSGTFSCLTADCGSNSLECNGNGASPPATLAEFTLSSTGSSGLDFYDVSLVDGYNLPVLVAPTSTSSCAATGCVQDLNEVCPEELRVGEGEGRACRSACEAFGRPEFCCSGAYGNPDTCRPSRYSEVFKTACPTSYSYAYDDKTSTFTCGGGGDYTITFCPGSTTSQKSPSSSSDSSTNIPSPIASAQSTNPKRTGGVMLEDDSWLASMAIGDTSSSTRTQTFLQHKSSVLVFAIVCALHRLVYRTL